MLKKIQNCFILEKVLYTNHAKDEMEKEEFGEIKEREVFEAVLNGKIIETYLEDEPYPSCLIYEGQVRIGHYTSFVPIQRILM